MIIKQGHCANSTDFMRKLGYYVIGEFYWRGFCGRVVKVVNFKPLAPYRCGFESRQGLWIFPCEGPIRQLTECRLFYSGARSCLK
jgi:hypothetical protein